MKIDHLLYKTIGFLDYKNSEIKGIRKEWTRYKLDNDSIDFLNQAYYSEYLNIMFNNDCVDRLYKEIDYDINLVNIDTVVHLSKVELFIFNETKKDTQLALFSLSYSINDKTIDNISNISNILNKYNTELVYQEKTYLLKEFISEKLLNKKNFYENSNPSQQYSGSKFKNYIIIDTNHKNYDRENILYEIGTCSRIGTIETNDIYAPALTYKNKIFINKISCFNNYEGLSLLDSFTIIGSNNYNAEEIYTHKTWDDIYFTIYIFNLYMKCVLQILSNDFSNKPMGKRKEFQEFYNKYYFNKISFNFLPNELHNGIRKGLDLQDDINFISKKLETLATQINEKNQKQQEILLLIISVIALLGTPLDIEGFRELIGINNLEVYNYSVYTILIISIVSFLLIKFKKNK